MSPTSKNMSILFYFIAMCYHVAYTCNNEWKGMVNYDVDAERVYYIGCVEVEWNYAPSGKNLVSGESINKGMDEAIWLLADENRIGPKYLKGLYREFTDSCFTDEKDRSEDDKHLGALGPNIRALTGEKIKIFYKNTCSFPNSLHAHGLRYDKTSEGAPYNDGTDTGDIIAPNGGKHIYVYDARKTMVDEGISSKMWLYHSHVDEVRDIYTGLFGAIIITKSGYETSETDLRPRDVDREFTTFMVLYDENNSLLFEKNLDEYLGGTPPDAVLNDEEFIESNLMHAINGYLFGNLDTLTCTRGEKVRWYTASFGNEGDGPHSPHWHGNIAVDALGDNTDTVVLIPGTTYTVTMTIDEPGKWLYHCHVHDHIEAGMITTYTADDPSNYNEYTHCCRGRQEPYESGLCWGCDDEEECGVIRGQWCQWDTTRCQKPPKCDTAGIGCLQTGINNCCSGSCNIFGRCS